MANVVMETVLAEELQTKIQEAKDAGRRILALAPADMKRIRNGKRISDVMTVASYVLVTQ